MGAGIVPELGDAGVCREYLLDDAPLDASPAAMDQTNDFEPGVGGGFDVGVYHRWDIARGECMEIELTLDRNADGVTHCASLRGLCSWP